ncbi:MAG TPA: HAMP domain-containing sensor histidine kinase [Candidatus Desulfobacillus sp.]|nr:HAMP domain-containing sensor histidine kinase [Candidatus Desulfobacillus sp.]
MGSLYPKTFLRLIVIGFGLVLLPLLFALGSAALKVQRLAAQSELTVREAALATRSSREMQEILTGMERALRQYLVLKDRRLLEDYDRLHGEFTLAAERFSSLPLDADGRSGLHGLLEQEGRLLAALESGGSVTAEEFAEMEERSRDVLASGRRLVDAGIESLRASAVDMRRRLLWLLLIALPVTLVIALWFRSIISAQLRQVDQAVRAIGQADPGESVAVSGPEDLAFLGRRLDWLRRRLAELEEQKTVFLRHVSHDLKTPLTAIREGAQLLGEGVPGPLNEQQKTILSILEQNSRRLQQLIEELVAYQQAGFAAGSIAPQPFALDEVCAEVLHGHLLLAASRAVRFERRLEKVVVEGDAEKLRAVVDNLVSNAIKFSPADSIVRIGLRAEEGQAVLDIADQGAGVDAAERERIFEPFFRGTRKRQGEVEGSGLGLAIAREYVLAHRGKIEALETDKGAHFRVILPLVWEKRD